MVKTHPPIILKGSKMENKVFKISKVSGKGRKVKFTVSAGDTSIPCYATVSMKLINLLSTASSKEVSAEERAAAEAACWVKFFSAEGYSKLLDWSEENLSSFKEETEAFAELMAEVLEEVLPKAQQ